MPLVDPYFLLQKGVYTALTADAALMAKVTAVYDEPPQHTAELPYVVIGDDEHEPWDTDTEVGLDSAVDIHVWGRDHRGTREVKQIQGDVYRILHRQGLAVDGMQHVLTICQLAEIFVDADGVTRHGVQRFRVVVEEE